MAGDPPGWWPHTSSGVSLSQSWHPVTGSSLHRLLAMWNSRCSYDLNLGCSDIYCQKFLSGKVIKCLIHNCYSNEGLFIKFSYYSYFWSIWPCWLPPFYACFSSFALDASGFLFKCYGAVSQSSKSVSFSLPTLTCFSPSGVHPSLSWFHTLPWLRGP